MGENEIDLDKLRDERCIPVARGVLNDMAVDMMPTADNPADVKPVVMKILQRTLDADLNVQTENPYVFQLLLGALSGLNTTIQKCATVPIDDARYGAIGKKILGILATSNVKMGTLTPGEVATVFAPVEEQLNALFKAEQLSWLEVKYIMDSILAVFRVTQNVFGENVEMSTQRMEAKILGLETMGDLTMKRLNEALVTPTAPMVPRETVLP